ncbi:RICIN domain-containing protein, partial [Streptomyces clavuligerus]
PKPAARPATRPPAVKPKPKPPAPRGTRITGVASGRCLDVAGGRVTDGAKVVLNDCTGTSGRRWEFRPDGTVRTGGYCMDVAWGSTADGALVQIARCSGNPAQTFVLSTQNDLVNPQANKCVDAKDFGTTKGTPIQIWGCGGATNQKWRTR